MLLGLYDKIDSTVLLRIVGYHQVYMEQSIIWLNFATIDSRISVQYHLISTKNEMRSETIVSGLGNVSCSLLCGNIGLLAIEISFLSQLHPPEPS